MIARIYMLTLLTFLSGNAQAIEVGGIDIPEQRGNMKLLGAGVLKKGFFFKVYAGALYVDESGVEQAGMDNTPKRLDIHFYHYTPKKFMIRAANETLSRNLNIRQLSTLKPHIDQLHRAYRNGEKGAMASIIHQPGKGLSYLFNEQPVVTIPCDDFANAYFTVWLGEKPSSQTMKRALLGASRDQQDEG